MSYKALSVSIEGHVATISLNRPDVRNAINMLLWHDLDNAITCVEKNDRVRVIIITGQGDHFCSGIDLSVLADIAQGAGGEQTEEKLRERIAFFQSVAIKWALCTKPIIAAINGACIGAGLDLVSVMDIRLCTADAYFCIKEVDLGIVADVGSLQWLTGLIPQGQLREMAYTAKKMDADSANRLGLVNSVYASRDDLMLAAKQLAETIAQKSPAAIKGVKQTLNLQTVDSYKKGLDFAAKYNAENINLKALSQMLKN